MIQIRDDQVEMVRKEQDALIENPFRQSLFSCCTQINRVDKRPDLNASTLVVKLILGIYCIFVVHLAFSSKVIVLLRRETSPHQVEAAQRRDNVGLPDKLVLPDEQFDFDIR
jgi:hypothetical protein